MFAVSGGKKQSKECATTPDVNNSAKLQTKLDNKKDSSDGSEVLSLNDRRIST
jgi:hypothetical protein